MIEFIYNVKELINNDAEASKFMKILYMPNYGVSLCEKFVASCDLSQHISVPGSEVR